LVPFPATFVHVIVEEVQVGELANEVESVVGSPGSVHEAINVPVSLMSSILNWVEEDVCLKRILKLDAEGIVPVGETNNQLAVPDPVGRE
jgi:hypothetical protein